MANWDLARFEEEVLAPLERRSVKDRNWKKIWQSVFDHYTIGNLFRAFLKADLEGLEAVISPGKEASVFKAVTKSGEARAVKVYRVETSDFRRMHEYIVGDPRFDRIPKNRRKLVETWCRKEFKNLQIAERAKIHSPKPYAFAGNVLVIQFLGDEWAAPLIKDIELEEPRKALESIVQDMKKLYKVGLVHSDLSEFNILYWKDSPWLIDFAQGTLVQNPRSQEFLERDCQNIARFFNKIGVNVGWRHILEFVKSSKEMDLNQKIHKISRKPN